MLSQPQHSQFKAALRMYSSTATYDAVKLMENDDVSEETEASVRGNQTPTTFSTPSPPSTSATNFRMWHAERAQNVLSVDLNTSAPSSPTATFGLASQEALPYGTALPPLPCLCNPHLQECKHQRECIWPQTPPLWHVNVDKVEYLVQGRQL
jgi:hypothetical protein